MWACLLVLGILAGFLLSRWMRNHSERIHHGRLGAGLAVVGLGMGAVVWAYSALGRTLPYPLIVLILWAGVVFIVAGIWTVVDSLRGERVASKPQDVGASQAMVKVGTRPTVDANAAMREETRWRCSKCGSETTSIDDGWGNAVVPDCPNCARPLRQRPTGITGSLTAVKETQGGLTHTVLFDTAHGSSQRIPLNFVPSAIELTSPAPLDQDPVVRATDALPRHLRFDGGRLVVHGFDRDAITVEADPVERVYQIQMKVTERPQASSTTFDPDLYRSPIGGVVPPRPWDKPSESV
jgi:hypothetical protein